MTGLVLTLLLALSGQPAASVAADAAPAEDAKTPLQTAQDNYIRAQQLYAESCSERAYAAYDDICSQLASQVHQYRVDLDRLERAEELRPKTPAAPH